MIIIEKKVLGLFKSAEIWFEDMPHDINGYSSVTFKQCSSGDEYAGFERSVYTTQVINLNVDIDEIWGNLHAKSCRYKINRSIREGVVVKKSNKYTEFYEMYKDFALSKGIGYGGIGLDVISRFGTLFMAYYKCKLISGMVFFEDENNICLVLAGSKRFQHDISQKIIGFSNKHLLWEAIKYSNEKGLKQFNLGGMYKGDDSKDERVNINSYKQSFGGIDINKYIYKKTYNPLYKFLRGMSQKFL